MSDTKAIDSLRTEYGQHPDSEEEFAPNSPIPHTLERYYERFPQLKDIPSHIIRQAWFTMAHLLLPTGSKIADMGCGDGALTYAMAALNPSMTFIGVDKDKKAMAAARKTYQLSNLSYITSDILTPKGIEAGSLDAVVNSFILHEIYSAARYNDRAVVQTLQAQFALLKPGGFAYIRDYALEHPGEYILMEMPDTSSGDDKDITKMSETELLLWYAEHARPSEDPGCHGFFLEELPARVPQTRLFRLPYKWAYEFIMRKDDRAGMRDFLQREYTYFTERDFRKELRGLGARVAYSSPHWNQSIIKKRFEGRFRLYGDNGKPMAPPPTSFITVVQKTSERGSISLTEHRPSHKTQNTLRVSAMRNERTGKLVDIVSRNLDVTEILPYRVSGDNELSIFIHDGVPRGIINAVPRHGRELDGKRWSGHMAEAIAIPSDKLQGVIGGELKETVKFARDYLGLKPAIESHIEPGASYYPSPDTIDEMVKTCYLRVREHEGDIEPKIVMDDISGFTSIGRIHEISAQKILDAIAVGLIPNARLELQITALFDRLGIEAETWDECPLVLEESEPDLEFDPKEFAKLKADNSKIYKAVRGTAGNLRTVQSIFVDEGWVKGNMSGLAARDMEFVLSEENTLNKAVILPMTQKAGQIMMGFEVEYMPVPERHEGSGASLKMPSVNLPKDITDIHQAQKYVADLFDVPVENVWKLGESYFSHPGVTPQRVFPFAVATKGKKQSPISGPIQFAPMKYMWKVIGRILDFKYDTDMLSKFNKVYRRMGYGSEINMGRSTGLDFTSEDTSPGILQAEDVGGLAPPIETGTTSNTQNNPAQTEKSEGGKKSEGRTSLSDSKKLHIK